MPNRLVIVGTGGHARVVRDIAIARGWDIVAFVEPRAAGGREHSPKLGGHEIHEGLSSALGRGDVFIGIGANAVRESVSDELRSLGPELAFPGLVHPSAFVEGTAEIGEGALVCAGAIVGTDARVGRGVIVNSGAIVDHDADLGEFCHVSPGVRLAGSVTVGRRAHIGIGASVIPGCTIGPDAVVGAGAVVLEDVAPSATVVGVPARPTR